MEPVNLEYFPDLCNRKYKIVELVADHLRDSGLDEIIKIRSIKRIVNNDYK